MVCGISMLLYLLFVYLFELVRGLCLVFFFKQKTAYEMRISDWSSDVCSSDLLRSRACSRPAPRCGNRCRSAGAGTRCAGRFGFAEIGRASCRERVCQYV